MQKLTTAVVLALVLLPCLAWAQFYGIEKETEPEVNGLRVRAGYFDLGDYLDADFGVGADYRFRALGQTWMVGGEYAQADWASSGSGGSSSSLTYDVFDANLNWIGMTHSKSLSWYYGAGVGYHRIENSSSDDSIGFQVVLGADLESGFSLDLRYILGTEFGESYKWDIDGLRATVGYWFK